MKTVMTKVSPLLLFVAVLVFSGCYTELATREYEEPYYAADTDTSYTEEEITINNHYYLDDDYRRSRFRLSFNYYYPTYHSSWIGGYYSSYYDDYYWGLNRPWWWYHYPGYVILYPTPWWPPIYDPWYPYPYYPPVAYYPTYYPYPSYPNTPGGNPGRIRDNGATRDNTDPGERSRPVGGVGATTGTEVASGVRIREPLPTPTVTTKERSANDIPWWERQKQDRQRSENNERTAGRPTIRQKEPRRTDAGSNQPRTEGTRPQTRPAEKKNRNVPESAAPAKRNDGGSSSGKTQRPREERRSYTPPPAQQAPASSAPRSGNSGSTGSSNSGGRKRTE